MTERKDDQQKAQEEKSFKAQILADLQKANRARELREKELLEQAEAEKKARLAEKKRLAEAKLKQEVQTPAEPLVLTDDSIRERQQGNLSASAESRVFVAGKEVAERSNQVAQEEKVAALEKNSAETAQLFSEKAQDTSNQVAKPVPTEQKVQPSLEVAPENRKVEKMNKRRRRQKTDNLAKRISLILISAIILVLLMAGFFGYRFVKSSINPLDKNDTDYVQVEIPEGSGNKLIGQILEKAGVIKSGQVFNYYSKFKNYTNFQSGYYNLQKSMSLDDIADALQKGGSAQPTKPVLGKILITEGYTIKQISKAIESNANTKKTSDKTPFSSKDFLKLIQSDDFIAKMQAKYPKLLANLPSKSSAKYQLEGYLFPATYNYYKETSLESLAEEMISTMNQNLSDYYDMIAAKNLTVNEVLTVASLVEKEGSTDEDRRNIASVFYNRLNAGMPLQSNIAILYAMDKLGSKTTLAEDAAIDTSIDSPYNIYTNTGLMPGAVDSPGLSAIKATVTPASTDYYYFVADVKTGKVYYAKTYEEHASNVEKYVNSQLTNE